MREREREREETQRERKREREMTTMSARTPYRPHALPSPHSCPPTVSVLAGTVSYSIEGTSSWDDVKFVLRGGDGNDHDMDIRSEPTAIGGVYPYSVGETRIRDTFAFDVSS
jgi:hypothetical protein